MSSRASLAVIIVAAGRGERAGGGQPKQYRALAGVSLLARSISAMATACPHAEILCVIGEEDGEFYANAVAELPPEVAARLRPPVAGGPTRQASVHNGMEALARDAQPPAYVLIHDAARPFVPQDAGRARPGADGGHRRGDPRNAAGRHRQARRRGRAGAGHPRPGGAQRCADPAGLRLRAAFGRAPPRRRRRGATTSPTTRRWPSGPGCWCMSWRARRRTSRSPARRTSRPRNAGSPLRRRAGARPASAWATTSTPSARAMR